MSKLKGYRCGGTIHFVINNQIGFTTDYDDARSSIYCTDLAKIIDSPVLHINGDDAEAVSFASSLALAYRQKFKKDIFIDLLCYRRHGHNESDEPKFTQPSLYNLIAKHPNPRDVYFNKLKEEKDIDANYSEKLQKDFKQREVSENKKLENYEKRINQVEETLSNEILELQENLDTSTSKYYEEMKNTVVPTVINFEQRLSSQLKEMKIDFTVNQKHDDSLKKEFKDLGDPLIFGCPCIDAVSYTHLTLPTKA